MVKSWYIEEEIGIGIANAKSADKWTIDYDAFRRKYPDKSEEEIQSIIQKFVADLNEFLLK